MNAGWNEAERAGLVALLRLRPNGMSWSQIALEVNELGSALALLREHKPQGLFEDDEVVSALADARRDIATWRSAGHGFLTFLDEDYPAQLREIHEVPPVLFHRGDLVPNDNAVSVVGSRAASLEGLRLARTLARDLVARGITVIAGLAKGIDTSAHTAALESGGRTVAVIGTGISRYYPAENHDLQDRIARDGLVISQFWPDAPPRQQQFPMRNAVMSGYGRATIVVEAGETSGARIQARQAVEHGRPVILTSLVVAANNWPHKLIGRPGVYVAASTAQAMAIVEDLATGPERANNLLKQVLAARE